MSASNHLGDGLTYSVRHSRTVLSRHSSGQTSVRFLRATTGPHIFISVGAYKSTTISENDCTYRRLCVLLGIYLDLGETNMRFRLRRYGLPVPRTFIFDQQVFG